MNKEKLMQLVSEALDKGATLNLFIPQYRKTEDWSPVSKEEAFKIATDFAEAIGTNNTAHNPNDYTISTDGFYIACPYIPAAKERYMEEDIDLTGGVEDVS